MKKLLSLMLIALIAMSAVFANGAGESTASAVNEDGTVTYHGSRSYS